MPSKGRAMGYTDYYKNNSNTPEDTAGPSLGKPKIKDEADDAAEKRRAAVQRRLRVRKAGK